MLYLYVYVWCEDMKAERAAEAEEAENGEGESEEEALEDARTWSRQKVAGRVLSALRDRLDALDRMPLSLFHFLTFSIFHFLTFSLSHFFTFSPSHSPLPRTSFPFPSFPPFLFIFPILIHSTLLFGTLPPPFFGWKAYVTLLFWGLPYFILPVCGALLLQSPSFLGPPSSLMHITWSHRCIIALAHFPLLFLFPFPFPSIFLLSTSKHFPLFDRLRDYSSSASCLCSFYLKCVLYGRGWFSGSDSIYIVFSIKPYFLLVSQDPLFTLQFCLDNSPHVWRIYCFTEWSP